MKLCTPILVAAMLLPAVTGSRAASSSQVGLIEIHGPIGPATASYVARAIDAAEAQHDSCLIIQLNTPGGLVASSQEIVDKFYASPVPVVVYVAPSGAGAVSAGTYITLAANIAAMAPNTTIGAAHPVGSSGEGDTNSIMWTKAENAVASWVVTIAQKRGRNADWAEAAVRKSVSVTSEKALDLNVIDLIAKDLPDLLEQLDGHEVNGKKLQTAGAGIVEIPMSMGEKLFQMIWHPQVMLLLLMVSMYGLIAELNNPGAILPGVVGAIALILFLYMAMILPVNVAGLALIILAVVLFVIDLYAPTHGVLTAGGVIAFFLGVLMLFNRAVPGFRLPLGWIVFATAATALFFVFVVGAGLRAQRLPVRAGREAMLGKVVPALEHIDAKGGRVFVEGEYWNAVSEAKIEKDQPVEIVAVEGLTLKVKPKT
jgi:membrane-bound serine protease (ClpP class)